MIPLFAPRRNSGPTLVGRLRGGGIRARRARRLDGMYHRHVGRDNGRLEMGPGSRPARQASKNIGRQQNCIKAVYVGLRSAWARGRKLMWMTEGRHQQRRTLFPYSATHAYWESARFLLCNLRARLFVLFSSHFDVRCKYEAKKRYVWFAPFTGRTAHEHQSAV